MQTATVSGISRWISATRGSVSAKGRIISPATCIADPTADESFAEIGVGLLIGGELDDTVGELLGILCFYPVDHLNLPVPMASLAHTSISCWSVARTLAACSGIRTAANTSPSTPWAAAAALAAPPLRRGVRERGGWHCLAGCAMRTSVVAVGSLRSSRSFRRQGGTARGVVSVALANTSELAEVSRRNNLRPFAEKSV